MNNLKLEQIPVLHVRGTHYQVGFSIGRTFKNLIEDFLETWDDFRGSMIPAYESEQGKNIYDSCLTMCRDKYPQYMQEIQGISDGSSIPFYKIFLLHIETLIIHDDGETKDAGCTGCTSIICNNDNIILGHTEDAAPEMLHNFFIVCAEIVDDAGQTVEDFSTLTYPGYLPGYTMGFNAHGIVYSVNTLTPTRTFPGRTPVHFITRALLAARTKDECLSIIKDEGVGIADGFSLNLISVNEGLEPILCNIEIGPSQNNKKESEISILDVGNANSSVHCNKYLRLNIPEEGSISSNRRHAAINLLPSISSLHNVKDALSNQSDETFPVYRNIVPVQTDSESGVRGYDHDYAATVAVGLFDIKKKTWSIYANKPNNSQPVVVLPMNF